MDIFITLLLLLAVLEVPAFEVIRTAYEISRGLPALTISMTTIPKNGIVSNKDKKVTIICTTNRRTAVVTFYKLSYKFLYGKKHFLNDLTRINKYEYILIPNEDSFMPKYNFYYNEHKTEAYLEIFRPDHRDTAVYVCDADDYHCVYCENYVNALIFLKRIIDLHIKFSRMPYDRLHIETIVIFNGDIEMKYLEIIPLYNKSIKLKRFAPYSCRYKDTNSYYNIYICDTILQDSTEGNSIISIIARLYYSKEYLVYQERIYIYDGE